jgi:superfamily II DNA or RNA helicase
MPTATTERLTLRDYQTEALDRIDAAAARGCRAQLGVAATGLGKTIIFTSLARRIGGRTLILAHRDELITQAWHKVREVWPEAEVGVVKGPRNDVTSQVVCASVQTLSRPRRLGQLLAATDGSTLLGQVGPFSLVVIDEAHHGTAASYERIIRALEAGTPDGPLLLGVTATPKRADGKGLDRLFSEVTFVYDVLYGIRAGYLSDLRGLAVELADFNTADVKVTAGDFNAGDAGRLLMQAHAPDLIVKAWQEHAAERRTLVFCPTVAMAGAVADAYRHAGIAAGMVHGGTDPHERARLLADFQSGALQVMANCAVLTEGYDNPRVDCVIVARPTRSQGLYVQMVGRGTRRHPDKADCLIMDLVGATADHTLQTIPSLFGLEKKHRDRARDGSGTVASLAQAQHDDRKRAGALTAREVALFESVRAEGIAWVRTHSDGAELRRYVRPMADRDHRTVVLAERPSGWLAGVLRGDGARQVLIKDVEQEMAQGVAEDYLRLHATHTNVVRADAPWRKRPPTPKQRRLAKRWHLPVEKAWTAGELADALDAHIARIKQRKAR